MTLLFSLPGGAEWILIVFSLLIIFLIPAIFYILTLQSTLNAISIENRKMPSSNVWLLLIPFFNIVWHFIVIDKMANSIKAEFNIRQIQLKEDKPAYSLGLAMCIVTVLNMVPMVGALSGIATVVLWIMYWVKINEYKTQIVAAKFNNLGIN